MVNRAKVVRAEFKISDGCVLDAQLRAVTILPRFAGDHLNLTVVVDLSDTAQHFTQNGPLLFELRLVRHVLVLTAAAAIEVWTMRLHTKWRPREHLGNVPAQQIVLG